MARLRRDGPYFWVTWLTKLLAGRTPANGRPGSGPATRAAAGSRSPGTSTGPGGRWPTRRWSTRPAESWEELGYQVFTERQNSLSLKGEAGTLGGRPDLVARKGDAGTIIDVKTGKPGPAHIVQVMLYMYAVPRAMGRHRDVIFNGQVAYTDHAVDIPAEAVDEEFIERLAQLVRRLAPDAPARRVPSPGECRFCPITAADCPDRAAEDGFEEGVTTDF